MNGRTRSGEPALMMTARQVAGMLCMSVRTLWRLVADGRFPQPVRFNRKLVRWKRDEAESAIRAMKGGLAS